MDNRTIFLLVLCNFATNISGYRWARSSRRASKHGRPNIVLVMADDIGWNDVGWKNSEVKTPNLDRLARNGVILENSYVLPQCTPSRAAMLTGKYPHKLGLQYSVAVINQPKILPRKETILPQLLKKVGYKTHLVGKWHLGHCSADVTPTARGYDTFYGHLQPVEDYYTRRIRGIYDFWENDRITFPPNGSYNTDLFTDRAIRIITNHKKRSSPFFLTLSYSSPHFPLQAPRKYTDMFPNVKDSKRRTYLGMLSSLDDGVGKVIKALKDSGHMKNTIVIFINDNGGDSNYGASNYPLRGIKGSLWEGAMRVINLVYSPTYIRRPGCKHHGLVHAVDWFDTILDMARYNKDRQKDGLDSRSQWRHIQRGYGSARNEFVYKIDDVSNTAAIRCGDYKLIQGDPRVFVGVIPFQKPADPTNSEVRLYNIKNDPSESHDLARKRPRTVKWFLRRLNYYGQFSVPAQNQPILPSNITAPNGILQLNWC